MLAVVGGAYREWCMRPLWDEVFGSAGRAASAIAHLGGQASLHCYSSPETKDALEAHGRFDEFDIVGTPAPQGVGFYYTHGLSRPSIRRPREDLPPLSVKAEKVLRFGMLESTAVVTADYAVFDPQNAKGIESFRHNGSTANHLALVLNRYEARSLLGQGSEDLAPEDLASQLAARELAEVVIIKMGPEGAMVWHAGTTQRVPAYQTPRVWKIGSGDQFAANFAYAWMEEGRAPVEAADRASRATAYYCEHRGFPSPAELDAYRPEPVIVSERFASGYRPNVYLAGPFFTLGQLWVVDQARQCLRDMGLDVFSPYHEVGPGPAEEVVPEDIDGIRACDLMLAIVDGADPGTVFEVGYARMAGKPVVVYVENESAENLKMMVGSDCFMCDDFVSAIYRTVWVAAEL
ncbi:PfkB family carbohydrate kinase [Novilysobacter selenitireducens]|uniref:Nucleoside 2-deoxyribosyltransferase n=1 Tax=Novilysobacter selenitireducens TaxID=2872639 RepID=A0ABS7T2H7_9GAMM|nr:PfkB family carbohydrate kinase [Lysobacter selenitireducens]MBZ4038071.1 nucleoside 2-deoxyribosyltransferase [Lysobacter selenitireducens]